MIPTAREQDMASKNDPGDSGARVRPIDAPDLPAWLGKPKAGAEVDAEEDAPTQSGAHPMPLMPEAEPEPVLDSRPAPSPHDPRELARKLAEEAKMRLAASQAARTGGTAGPIPQREPQERKEETPMAAEDPRELAKRLAEEAKKRLKEPSPASRPGSHSPPPSSFPPMADEILSGNVPEDRPATERAGAGAKPLSALEALAAAREAEKRAKQAAPVPPPPPGERTVERMAAERQARPEPISVGTVQRAPTQSVAPQGSAPLGSVPAIVQKLFPRAQVAATTPVSNPEVFRALWRAHSARALHEGDIQLVATASVLQDAVGRVSSGWLAAARMDLDGHAWAVWVDLERSVVLAVARPAEIYLAGL
jgi:hypothetical protein